jgi:hypothetical protein
LLLRGALDGAPELHQIREVPVELLGCAADGGRASDHAHPLGDRKLIDDILQLVTVFTLDAARYAATARIVGHQHQISAGETDESGERRALVAALVLIHLDDHFLVLLDRILDAGAADLHSRLEVSPGDLLEWQKTVAFRAVFDERSLQAGLDAGDDPLVDVALALFLAGGFDVEIDQLLTINDGDAQLFRLRRIEQHAFHCYVLPRSYTG